VFGEFNGKDRIISSVDPQIQTHVILFVEKTKSVVYANNSYDLEALKQNICEAIYNIQ
jgi:hypothetical protein